MSTLTAALVAAVSALAVGTAALWTHPHRELNRALAFTSGLLAVWLLLVHATLIAADASDATRAVWTGLAFSPGLLALCRDIVAYPAQRVGERLRRTVNGWLYAMALAAFAWTPWFMSASAGGRVSGWAPLFILIAAGAAHTVFAVASFRLMKQHLGAARLELQLLALGGVLTAGTALLTAGFPLWSATAGWERLMPLLVVASFGGTVWSLVAAKVLDTRQILTLSIEKGVLVACVAVFIWGLHQLTSHIFPDWLSHGFAVAFGLWFAAEARPWLLQVSGRKAAAEKLRHSAVDIAREDLRPEAMEDAFCRLLRQWAQSDRVIILMASNGRLSGGGLDWDLDLPEIRLLHALRWATPERLQRARPRLQGEALRTLLQREGIGAVVASAGPSLAFVVAIGIPRHHRPFIYPEIRQLLGLASIIESSLSRAHYLMKAQHADQLATVGLLGASIAHEIRNPLVSIKTFVQLLPHRYDDPAFREKFFRLVGGEVSRIDRLTEQLMDLSAPRVFSNSPVRLNALLQQCVELLEAKADDKKVAIKASFDAEPDLIISDPNALKQVVLNLGLNGIQALDGSDGERWIRLSTSNIPEGISITVSDNGPGIPREVWDRLFQPFQSTKISGFGLGLAICKDILTSLHATISAEPPISGCGATFRIIVPCQPPTS